MKPFEIIEHTADIGLRAFGRTKKELFENMARGMFDILVDIKKVKPLVTEKVILSETDIEALLAGWLNELLFVFEIKKMLFCDFKIKELRETYLEAEAFGEKINSEKHEITEDIKACTYHMLKVEKIGNHWVGEVIFDV
ncbi:MAG: archease [Actinomycetia bacterium]|nr:archease [Actinomycetes bacterium]